MRRRRIVTVLLAAASVLVVLVGGVWLLQRRLIYLPDRSSPPPPGSVEVGRFVTEDGIEHTAWIVPAGGSPTATVLVFAGNAGNRAGRLPLARRLASVGLEVVLFDYRGYGGVGGSPSEDGLRADAAAARRFLDGRAGGPIVYFGESIGAAVAVDLALDRPPAAMVLRSPFASLAEMAREHYGPLPRWLLRDRWPVEEPIEGIAVPVLVIAGTDDDIVPLEQSRRVAEAAAAPLVTIPAGHNDPALSSGPAVAEAVRTFLERVLPGA